MTTLTLPEAPTRMALQTCIAALQRIADYKLDPALDQRMLQLGEQKEFLSEEEHAELMALVDFSQKRSIEKFEAQLALQRIRATFPELTGEP